MKVGALDKSLVWLEDFTVCHVALFITAIAFRVAIAPAAAQTGNYLLNHRDGFSGSPSQCGK